MRNNGSIYRRCGCRGGAAGAPRAAACPLLADDPGHGSWYYAIDLPRRADGRVRRRVRRGGFATEEAALAALVELRRPDARADAAATISTGAWLRAWLASRDTLAPLTQHGYSEHVTRYLEPMLGHIPLRALRRAHVQDMLGRLACRGKGGQPLSPNSLARIRATLRAAMNAAIRDGHLELNPATHLDLPRARRARAVIWTEHQIDLWKSTGVRPKVAVWTATQTAVFLTSARDHRLYAAFHLVALRGLRRAEAAGLRWCDIDFDNRVLQITRTIQRVNGTLMLCPPKTENSYRMVRAVPARHSLAIGPARQAVGWPARIGIPDLRSPEQTTRGLIHASPSRVDSYVAYPARNGIGRHGMEIPGLDAVGHRHSYRPDPGQWPDRSD
jgi:hypothetical protein